LPKSHSVSISVISSACVPFFIFFPMYIYIYTRVCVKRTATMYIIYITRVHRSNTISRVRSGRTQDDIVYWGLVVTHSLGRILRYDIIVMYVYVRASWSPVFGRSFNDRKVIKKKKPDVPNVRTTVTYFSLSYSLVVLHRLLYTNRIYKYIYIYVCIVYINRGCST